MILHQRLESERVEDGVNEPGYPCPGAPARTSARITSLAVGFLPPRVSRQHTLVNEQSTIRSPRKS